jgi:hypothetical protein
MEWRRKLPILTLPVLPTQVNPANSYLEKLMWFLEELSVSRCVYNILLGSNSPFINAVEFRL